MANIIVPNVTYSPKETGEILQSPSFIDPDMLKWFTVYDDIQNQEKIYFSNNLGKLTRLYESCGWAETGDGTTITEKTITTYPVQIQLSQCADVFTRTLKDQARKSGVNWNDLTGTEIEGMIKDLVLAAAKRDFFRFITLGDRASVNGYYQILDGFWRKVFNNVNSYCISKVGSIGSGSLADGAALTHLKTLYNGANNVLKEVEVTGKVFMVTGSIYDNLMASYESNSTGSDVMLSNLIDGQKALKFRGIDVVAFRSWDTYIAADLGNFAPHRIAYTVPGNQIIGIESASDFNEIKMWYLDKEDTNYIRMRYRAGFEFMHCDYIAVSY